MADVSAFGAIMNFAHDPLAATAADELLLENPDLLLFEEEGHAIDDIRWESAPTPQAA